MMSAEQPQPIRIRATCAGDVTDVRVLMPHPMTTGLGHDAQGGTVEPHHITDVEVTIAGRVVLAARMGIAVSQDPLLSFRVRGARPGDAVVVRWTDNRGARRTDQARVA